MGETHQYDHLYPHHQAAAPPAGATTSSRMGIRRTAGPGAIVEVQGGHIVRSTGRKDRHSKVCTAKGPRDRRVRLSAHTAIQFYDVQDRLGYDRPSKAVDWLIKKAKTAIDKLAELPAWKPTTTATPTATTTATKARAVGQQKQQEEDETHDNDKQQGSGGSSEREYNPQMDSFQITFQQHHQLNPGPGFLPPSLDSDAIADTIKSFFPMGSAGGGGGGGNSNVARSLSSFQNYPVPDLLSRTSSSSRNQDLRLSLQSFQEPILGHQHEQNHHHQVLFSGPAAAHYIGFDGSSSSGGGWSEHHQQQHQNPAEIGRFPRMLAPWSASGAGAGADSTVGSGGGGFIFNSIPLAQQPPQTVLSPVQAAPQLVQPMLFGQNQLLISQRGPLQSSNTPSVRWIDTADQIPQIHPGMGFSAGGGFSGFRVPARIQGDEEHDGIPNKPSSASSDSRR